MIGIGLTPEGINQNEFIYEFMMENSWRTAPRDIEQWSVQMFFQCVNLRLILTLLIVLTYTPHTPLPHTLPYMNAHTDAHKHTHTQWEPTEFMHC